MYPTKRMIATSDIHPLRSLVLSFASFNRWSRAKVLLPFLLLTAALSAQVDNVYVYGTVKDYTTSKKLDGVTVTVYKNGGKLAEVVTSANGKYEFNLDYGSDYKLTYSKSGIISKNISIDTKNIPEEERVGGHGMNVEMTLFQELPGIDFSVLQQPIGKAKFDPASKEVTWDLQYTEQVRSEIARLMKEYDEKKKREANAEEDFAKLMLQGDAHMASGEYEKAVGSFTTALGLKVGDPKATAKLSDAKMKLDELEAAKKRTEGYANLIKEADALFTKKSYEESKAKYAAALDIKEEEAYPKQRMKECQAFIDELAKNAEAEKKAKELAEKYKAAITAADAAFKGEKFEDARSKYQVASDIKSDEQYPKDQIALIAKKLEDLAKKAEDDKKAKELEAKYKAAIVAADAAFKATNYDQAKTRYNEALELKAEEKYPKDQLAAIDKKLEELAKKAEEEKSAKAMEERYKAAIAAADAAFKGDLFDEAKAKYNEALVVKPKEKYPTDQLAAIDKRISDRAKKAEEDLKKKELDDQYNAALATADAAFQGQKWEEAKGGYNAALKLKATERYPKDQLVAIDKAIADALRKAEEEKAQKELDEKYQALITSADKLLTEQKLVDAKAKYQEAVVVKRTENYPKEKIAEIDVLITEAARKAEEERKQKELNDKYNALITKADKAYDSKKYGDALNDYTDALKLKADEQHPKDRIADINGRMDAEAKAKAEKERLEREAAEKEKRYSDLITAADRAFTGIQYEEAKTNYSDALGVKPGEKHPTTRLTEIEKILAELAAKSEADRLKAEQDAAERARLEAERRLKEEGAAAVEASYREAITKGDLAFTAEKFDDARARFTEALAIKPEEKYPKDRLEAIEKFLADRERAKLDEEAAEAERRRLEEERRLKEAADAEAARLAGDDDKARAAAERALNEQYLRIIAEADAAMGEKTYEQARDGYTQALDIKPDEIYPKSKLEQIEKLLAEQERLAREAELAAQTKDEPIPVVRESNTIDVKKEMEAEQFMREAREREEREKYERIKKLRADLEQQESEHGQKAQLRRDGVREGNENLTKAEAEFYSGSDAKRRSYEEELAALREAWARDQQRMREKSDQARNGAWAANDALRDQRAEKDKSWAESRGERSTETLAGKEAFAQAIADDAAAAKIRTEQARSQNEQLAQTQAGMQQRGTAARQELQDEVANEKEHLDNRQRQVANRSEDIRLAAKEQLGKTSAGEQRSFAEFNRGQLANEYPQGVTEESYTEGNKVIVRRVLVQGNKADNYTKVIGKTQTYYFKNGQSITEWIWTKETE
ncbi:MAG: hypothetical protein IPO90_02435 [Flavobacteriales bacterium]|nr:hypothetical protein [Flavobacteriales bacterium]